VALPCSFCVFPPLHLCFLAKNKNKTIQLLKYKMYQKARRNKPKEESNFICSSIGVKIVKLTDLAFVEFVFCHREFWEKREN
jgi:hypothetical protein